MLLNEGASGGADCDAQALATARADTVDGSSRADAISTAVVNTNDGDTTAVAQADAAATAGTCRK